MNRVSLAIRASVIEYAKRVADLGLVANTQGNVSARDPDTGLIAVTPHDLPYNAMTPDDLVIVDSHGTRLAGDREPSYETAVHCVVYRERPDVGAAIHTEPTYVNCLGAVGRAIQPVVASLLTYVGGPVPVMPFLLSGSEEFGCRMLAVMGNGHAVVWANHGLLTVGTTVDQAFRRTVIVEHAAQIYHLALLHGEPTLVTHEQLQGGMA